MTALANRINAYLTPVRRQAIYRIILVASVLIAAISPAFSTQVALWTAVLTAAATVGSLILAAIVTRAPQWPVIYSALAALVAALVGTSVISQTFADNVIRILQAVITIAPLLVILARTDTTTANGSPAAEVIAGQAYANAYVPLVPPQDIALAVSPTTVAGSDKIVHTDANGDQTTNTLS